MSGLQVFCLFFSVSREPCRDHFRITGCQAPRFSSRTWPSKVLCHSREIECNCLPLWWLVKLSLGRHVCTQLSKWHHFLCPFMSGRACAAHLCHQPFVHLHAYLPPRPHPTCPPLPQPTSASCSLGPYLLLSASCQLSVGSTVLIRLASGDPGHCKPISASGARLQPHAIRFTPFQGGPTP